nr:MAG TPA: hypothetical protein [Caudoviricetes sp.]
MGGGLQIFDEQGRVKVDFSKRFTRVLGKLTLSGDGEFTIDGFPNLDPWCIVYPMASSRRGVVPLVRRTGRKIIWRNQGVSGSVVVYGVC